MQSQPSIIANIAPHNHEYSLHHTNYRIVLIAFQRKAYRVFRPVISQAIPIKKHWGLQIPRNLARRSGFRNQPLLPLDGLRRPGHLGSGPSALLRSQKVPIQSQLNLSHHTNHYAHSIYHRSRISRQSLPRNPTRPGKTLVCPRHGNQHIRPRIRRPGRGKESRLYQCPLRSRTALPLAGCRQRVFSLSQMQRDCPHLQSAPLISPHTTNTNHYVRHTYY